MGFSTKPSLKLLDVSQNRLAKVTPELGHCLALTHLDLSGNHSEVFSHLRYVEKLPSHIGVLQYHHLTELDLSGSNSLVVPPPGIARQGTEDVLTYLGKRMVENGLLFTGSGDYVSRCWDITTTTFDENTGEEIGGELLMEYVGHKGIVYCMEFQKNGGGHKGKRFDVLYTGGFFFGMYL